ncbi:hypothetical protein [Corynebacterium urinipleomorphum]|uniref:hypothetical protein n=1 Tax=Corynebacterium urinipleomorphum TaxID=1852380 RepID=UPI0011783DCB|nr:hypothetical protein [Corynebacterium urinipleomorphum]
MVFPDDKSAGTPTRGTFAVTVTATKNGQLTERIVTFEIAEASKPSLSSKVDRNKCVPALLGAGLPLLAPIPLGIVAQTSIPGLEDIQKQIGGQIQNANSELQKLLGIMGPEMAGQAERINGQLRAAGSSVVQAAAGLALLAADIDAITLVAVKCAPNNDDLAPKDPSSN